MSSRSSGLVDAELEFGVGDDDVARAGMLRRESVDVERDAPDSRGVFAADQFHHGVEIDVLVVLAGGRLGGRREQRLGQAGPPFAARPAGRCRTPIREACSPCSPSRSDSRAPPLRWAAALSFFTTMARPASCARSCASATTSSTFRVGEMIGDHVPRLREPEQRDLREHLALERDGVRQHDVESRQAIGGDDQQMLGIHVVDIAHLALVNLLQTAQMRLEKRCRLRNLLHACAACRLLPLRVEGRRLWRDKVDRSTRMSWRGAFFGAVIGLLITRSVWGAVSAPSSGI